MSERIPNLVIENCRITFKNFSGKETKFNPAGRRNFAVVLDEDTARKLRDDGWNVKIRPSRDDDDEVFCTMSVAVRFDNKPPKIFLIAGKKKTELDEDSVSALDYAEIVNVDLVISPSRWEVSDKSGIKAYLKSMYVTIEEDELAAKYSEYDEADYPTEDDVPF